MLLWLPWRKQLSQHLRLFQSTIAMVTDFACALVNLLCDRLHVAVLLALLGLEVVREAATVESYDVGIGAP